MIDEWEAVTIEINQSIRESVEKLVNEWEKQTKYVILPEHYVFISELTSLVKQIDPNGTMLIGSLYDDLNAAKLFNGLSIDWNRKSEVKIIFAQCLGVARSLKTGISRIACRRKIRSNHPFLNEAIVQQNNLVFILMPFTENWSDYIWNKELQPIVEGISEANLICKRADDLYGADVMRDVYISIATAKIVIAETTGRNANVFYELGIAHTLGKDVILLTQDQASIPFDLNRYRHFIYSNDPAGYLRLRKYLPNAILSIIQNIESVDARSS